MSTKWISGYELKTSYIYIIFFFKKIKQKMVHSQNSVFKKKKKNQEFEKLIDKC